MLPPTDPTKIPNPSLRKYSNATAKSKRINETKITDSYKVETGGRPIMYIRMTIP